MTTPNPTQATNQQIIEALAQIRKIISDLGIGSNIGIVAKQKATQPPEFYDTDGIMKLYKCGIVSAQKIIRCIKSVSDSLGIKGKVTAADLEYWKAYVSAHGANEAHE
jgi:hypothetical protein